MNESITLREFADLTPDEQRVLAVLNIHPNRGVVAFARTLREELLLHCSPQAAYYLGVIRVRLPV